MTSIFVLAVYLGIFLLSFLLDWFLSILNINFALKNHEMLPANLEAHIDQSSYSRSMEYALRKSRFNLVQSFVERIFILVILFTGIAGTLDTLVGSAGLSPYWQGCNARAKLPDTYGIITVPR